MRLRDLLDETTVCVGLGSIDKEECFEEMIDLLVRVGRVSDRAGALQAIQDRENLATTGIGNGVAVPHGKHPSLDEFTVALGISREGIEFDALDGEPVHMVMLLLANSNQPDLHLQALTEVSRLLQVPGFYRRAIAASTPAELLRIIDSEE